jgi:hypothetical protein
MNSKKRKRITADDIADGPMKKVVTQLMEFKEFSAVVQLISIPIDQQYDRTSY